MSKLRSLSTAFWSDPFIEDLSPQEKLLFIYLITNEKTNMLGIYEASIKKISFETDIKKETVQKALKAFERLGKVKYINNYVVLVNFLKHQNFNTNMKKSAIDTYNSLPNVLKDNSISVSKTNPLESFETLLNHFGMVPKIEVEREYEREVEKEVEKEDSKKVVTFSDDVYKTYDSCLKFFSESLHPKNEVQKNKWLDTIEKLNRIDKIPFEVIEGIVEKTRNNEFWSKNFLSILKLRKKNNSGIMYVQVFYEQFKQGNKQKSELSATEKLAIALKKQEHE